jgi:hypothetical protein
MLLTLLLVAEVERHVEEFHTLALEVAAEAEPQTDLIA